MSPPWTATAGRARPDREAVPGSAGVADRAERQP